MFGSLRGAWRLSKTDRFDGRRHFSAITDSEYGLLEALPAASQITWSQASLFGPVAFLELLAATAVTGIIASDFGLCANIRSGCRVVFVIAAWAVDVSCGLLWIRFGHGRSP